MDNKVYIFDTYYNFVTCKLYNYKKMFSKNELVRTLSSIENVKDVIVE